MPIEKEIARRLARALDAIVGGVPAAAALKDAGVTSAQAKRLIGELDAACREGAPGVNAVVAKRSKSRGKLERAVAATDGGSRGNPGEAACAVVLYDDKGDELLRRAKHLGLATNNQAEYGGVIYALELALQLEAWHVELRTDSELVARQLTGAYKVKNDGLKPYYARARELMDAFEAVTVVHVRRADNKLADKLVNACLDGKELPED